MADDKVNILLVDDQPSKLLTYESVLEDLDANLIKAQSPREALRVLLQTDIAIILMDVSMPELDGFQLAEMIRDHPRFKDTAIIFVSAVRMTDLDFLRGYQMGGVDYVAVPVVPEVLRAKVRIFADLYRKTRQLQEINASLERMVADRTASLESTARRLGEAEARRSLALKAGRMGSWDWDLATGDIFFDANQCRIAGLLPDTVRPSLALIRSLAHPEDLPALERILGALSPDEPVAQMEFRINRPDGQLRWCYGTAALTLDAEGRPSRISGVAVDITDRKLAALHQELLAREIDHRARNALAIVQSIVRLSRADDADAYREAVEGRIGALSRAHTLLAHHRWQGADLRTIVADELAAFAGEGGAAALSGPPFTLQPAIAQSVALAIHELTTNAAKYGALSMRQGRVAVDWRVVEGVLEIRWSEMGGPPVEAPTRGGFGHRLIHATIGNQPGSDVNLSWERSGLKCRLAIPIDPSAEVAETSRAEHEGDSPVGAGQRVLLVEDEALVGLMMADVLSDLGATVLGPLRTVPEALSVASEAAIDAAILDVTLGEDSVYPVAEALIDRNIPFAFVTGYGSESIDRRFAAAPVLLKPVSVPDLASFLSRQRDMAARGRSPLAMRA